MGICLTLLSLNGILFNKFYKLFRHRAEPVIVLEDKGNAVGQRVVERDHTDIFEQHFCTFVGRRDKYALALVDEIENLIDVGGFKNFLWLKSVFLCVFVDGFMIVGTPFKHNEVFIPQLTEVDNFLLRQRIVLMNAEHNR